MKKKLIKSRSSRMDTLEAMTCGCGCNCYDPCGNCSGGGSFFMQRFNNYGGTTPRSTLDYTAMNKATAKG